MTLITFVSIIAFCTPIIVFKWMSKKQRDEIKEFFQERKQVKYYCTINV